MFYNLAFKNVLRSFKDYSIYFLTLTFGVCIFYVFNSMDSQQVMLDFTARQSTLIYFMMEMINIVSTFVSVVLAGLVLYANNFILRRRKREFGLYMTMGVQRRRIALMLLVESVVIGVLSLAAGLALGLLLSQMLSVVVSKIYHVAVINYHFVISVSSLCKTLQYFAVIFVIVAALNVVTVSKARLIHLLHADRRNEGAYITRHLWVSVLFFLASVALLSGAYAWILKIKLYELGWSLLIIIVMGCVGTLLFFLSLSGFLLKAAQMWRGFYFKHLNMFVLRQLTSKLGSTFGSMAMVCLMLFLTIGALGSAVGMNEAIDDNFNRSTPFDMTLRSEYDILKDLEALGGDDGLLQNTYQYPVLITGSRFDQLTTPYARLLPAHRSVDYAQTGASFYGVSIEDYNACMRLAGYEELELEAGKFAAYCTYKPMMDVFRAAERDGACIEVAGTTLAAGPLVQQSMRTESVTGIDGLLILPAEVAARLKPTAYTLVGDYRPGIEDGTDQVQVLWGRLVELHASDGQGRYDVFYETKEALYDSNIGTYGTIMFIGIYIGLVFLIASAAVLSIQQLSQSSDDQERYRLLRKIGTDEKMIASAQTRQIALYFLMPLGLAAVHSWVGLYVVTDTLSSFGNFNILSTVLYIAFFVLVIYGGYFLATCWGAKHIIRERAME